MKDRGEWLGAAALPTSQLARMMIKLKKMVKGPFVLRSNISHDPVILGLVTCFGKYSWIRGISVLPTARRQDRVGSGGESWLPSQADLAWSSNLFTNFSMCPFARLLKGDELLYLQSPLRIKQDNSLKTLSTHSHLLLLIVEFTDEKQKSSASGSLFCEAGKTSSGTTFILRSEDKLSCVQL